MGKRSPRSLPVPSGPYPAAARRATAIENRKAKSENRRPTRSAFTLIECALVTVIVGVGVLAIVHAQQAYHQQNAYSARMGAALLLANEVRELTVNLPRHDPISGPYTWGPEESIADPYSGFFPYDDLDDLNGLDSAADFGGPIDALGQPVPDMNGWSQKVDVEKVREANISGDPVPSTFTDYFMMRITCRVLYQDPNAPNDDPTEVTRLTWVRSGY